MELKSYTPKQTKTSVILYGMYSMKCCSRIYPLLKSSQDLGRETPAAPCTQQTTLLCGLSFPLL